MFLMTTAMPPKVPAIPRNEIEPRLSITGFSAQDILALLRTDDWRAWDSRIQQVVFLYDFARSECSISLPAAVIGQVFEIHEAQVWKVQSKVQKTARPGHRPFALSSEQDDAGFLLLPTRRTLRISFMSSMSPYLESSKSYKVLTSG
jgi:hypothetical protein